MALTLWGCIVEAIGGAVPVGAVGYGPEAIDQLHAIFAPSVARDLAAKLG